MFVVDFFNILLLILCCLSFDYSKRFRIQNILLIFGVYLNFKGIEDDVDKHTDNFQSSENFDEHLRVEFDDTASEYSNMNSMTQKEYEEDEEK